MQDFRDEVSNVGFKNGKGINSSGGPVKANEQAGFRLGGNPEDKAIFMKELEIAMGTSKIDNSNSKTLSSSHHHTQSSTLASSGRRNSAKMSAKKLVQD